MNHLEFAALESAALVTSAWERWIARAEKLAGHSLDGDERTDRYSLDFAHDAFSTGQTPEQYVAHIRA